MNDLSAALARAFAKSLENGGNRGNRGNPNGKHPENAASLGRPSVATAKLVVATTAEPRGPSEQVATDATRQNRPATESQAVEANAIGHSPASVATVATVAAESGRALPPFAPDDDRRAAELDERAAIVEYEAGVPRAWAGAFARLDGGRPPNGFRSDRWQQIINDGGKFIDDWVMLATAIRYGWRTEDLFGVHPGVPDARFDAMGLVPLIRGGDVIDIKPDHATIRMPNGGCLTFYLRRSCPEAVPLWDLKDGHSLNE